ncbi:MAG: hypothetical protein KAH09_01080 [Desulfobacula sp.]|nr:hypothetical protein [Desulfobacula sp.]
MVDTPIESPEMWFDDNVWMSLSKRFSIGFDLTKGWPKPDIVSICTNPESIENDLLERLLQTMDEFKPKKCKVQK